MKIHTPLLVVALLLSLFSAELFAQFPGNTNRSRKLRSVIAGGAGNVIWSNTITATISGGLGNFASGYNATIPGGVNCKAYHEGSFVWSGADAVTTESVRSNSFTVRAPGGVRFITTLADSGLDISPGGVNGVALAPGGTAWETLSDSNAKTAVKAVDPLAVLAKVDQLPITEWEYKHDPHRRYFGPMAQDFHAAFGLGDNDKTINTLDADGVLFLSIKGLVKELKQRDKEIAEIKTKSAEIDRLRNELRALREQVQGSLPPAP